MTVDGIANNKIVTYLYKFINNLKSQQLDNKKNICIIQNNVKNDLNFIKLI